MRSVFTVIILALTVNAFAIDEPSEEELEGAKEEPMDLGRITVIGEDFTFEQELQLRLVRQALKTPRSDLQKDKDEWVCWYEAGVGTRLKYLKCARNGDLWALRPNRNIGFGGPIDPSGKGYGRIWESVLPTNEKKFEDALQQLPGSDSFDKEFIALSGTGQRPPRDVPSDAELDDFASAYPRVERLADRGAPDDAMIQVIEEEGLTLDRYNRIVDLIGTYQSLKNEVAERLH